MLKWLGPDVYTFVNKPYVKVGLYQQMRLDPNVLVL